MKLALIIPGVPQPAQRPRFTKFGIVYDAQKKLKDFMREDLILWTEGRKPLLDPIEIELEFYMPIPASYSKKKQREFRNSYHTKKPDLDNLTKLILDVCNKIVFWDDSQICSIRAFKTYAIEPKTVIRIFTLPHEDESIDQD